MPTVKYRDPVSGQFMPIVITSTVDAVFKAYVGDGATSTINVAHNLATEDVMVVVRESGGLKRFVEVEIRVIDVNNISLVFATAPAVYAYRVIVKANAVVPNSSISADLTNYATVDSVMIAMPLGAIIPYGGTTAPTGWHLCNGTAHGSSALQTLTGSANTPDLRDRWIVAAGSTYSRGDTGGVASVTLTEAQIPSHTHSNSLSRQLQGTDDLNYTAAVSKGDAGTPDTLTWSSGATGGGTAHENRPPYYALVYIIKKV